MTSPRKVLELLTSGDVDLQASTLQFLWRNSSLLSSRDLWERILALTGSPDTVVKFWAAKVRERGTQEFATRPPGFFFASGQPTTLPEPDEPLDLLLQKLESERPELVTLDLLKRIFARQDPCCLRALCCFLVKCGDPFQLSYLTKNIGQTFPQPDLLPVLVPFLKHADDRVVANTIEGLAGIGTPATVALFAQMLNHSSHRVRANAVTALGRHDEAVAFPVLEQMLGMKERPNFIISAFHAISELRAIGFGARIAALIDDPLVGEDALQTLGCLGASQAIRILEEPEIRIDATAREKILFAIHSALTGESKRLINPWTKPGAKAEGNLFLEIGEQKILVLHAKLTQQDATKIAHQAKLKTFGLLSQLLYRPRDEDIALIYSEHRLEPFWVLSGRATIDFTRTRDLNLATDPFVTEVRIGDRIVPVRNGRLMATGLEHCVDERTFKACIDAQSGEKFDYPHVSATRSRWVSDFLQLKTDTTLVIPPRVKASIVIRELLYDLLKPIKADEINSERIFLECLNLYFRPVYAFEFRWQTQEKTIILEVDGITGEVLSGKAVRGQSPDFFHPEDLFEITSEAAGLIIPGGEIALKLARAVFRSTPDKGTP